MPKNAKILSFTWLHLCAFNRRRDFPRRPVLLPVFIFPRVVHQSTIHRLIARRRIAKSLHLIVFYFGILPSPTFSIFRYNSSPSFLFPGEVERLLKEYRQNQELVGRIGTHFYQIIFPVQLRHHEKMGISTREVNTAKVRNGLRKKRNSFQARRVRSFSIIIHI